MQVRTQHTQKGFTLIEAIVAIGLFTAVMVIAIGALLSVTVASRKAEAQRRVVDTLSYILEDIARNVRTGYQVGCNTYPEDCTNGNKLHVRRYDNTAWHTITYEYKTVAGRGFIEKTDTATGNVETITPPEVSISNVQFSIIGADGVAAVPPDYRQPKVLINLKGTVRAGTKYESFIKLQTTVTVLNLDNFTIIP